jgi:hemoglobin-like flavoprotein
MKTAVVLFLLGCVAVSYAAECDSLTRLKVKAQWQRAYSTGSDREHFAQAVWRAIFAQAPDSRRLFSNVGGDDTNSAKFKAHASRVFAAFDIAVNMLDQPEALKAELDHLHKQHQERNIPDNYYNVMRTALGHVLPAQLGRCYDKDAWKACFDLIANGIRG